MPTEGDEFTTRTGAKCKLGKQIDGLFQLEIAANQKQAVIVPASNAWSIPRPAIFMLNTAGCTLLHCFKIGMFVYIKNPKTKSSSPTPS